ncbi:MAG: CBS domain-containing protein [Candidatus Dadabacteria bacterium]|nr:MAG: CBS domain-containing protein [Candidatus Dadabacteria bacterium]
MVMKISEAMKPCPYTISADTSIEEAIDTMELRQIRRVPVVENGELIGILHLKDAQLCKMAFGHVEESPSVGDICVKDPVLVMEDTPVAKVAKIMSDEKVEEVLVANEQGDLSGIFTVTDACKLIQLILNDLEQDSAS